MRPLLLLSLLFMSALTVSGADAPPINPGLWEITLTTQLPVASAPMTTTVCLSRAEIESVRSAPKSKTTDDCQVMSGGHGLSGNVLAYTMKCNKRKLTSSTTLTFYADRYEGTIAVKAEDHEFRQVIAARRLGQCEETELVKP